MAGGRQRLLACAIVSPLHSCYSNDPSHYTARVSPPLPLPSHCSMYITTRVWPASAQMAQALSKEEFLTVSNLMERDHWCTFIEEQILPTVPLWRSLMKNLRLWERLVTQTLCRFARKAASQWSHLSTELSTERRHRLFWIQIERSDPAREIPVRPRCLPYLVEARVPRRLSPPVRRRHYAHFLAALQFSTPLL